MAKPTGFFTKVRAHIIMHPEIHGSIYAVDIAQEINEPVYKVTSALRAFETEQNILERTGNARKKVGGGRALIEYRVLPKFFDRENEFKTIHPEVIGMYNGIAMWGIGARV